MISQKLRKVGNSYVVTIPREEVERQGLKEGQLLAIDITPLELKPVVSTELREAFEASWQRNEQAYRYLGEN
jgi:putative addiction module antidote